MTVAADGVNLRDAPSMSGRVLAVLAAGTPLTVTGPAVARGRVGAGVVSGVDRRRARRLRRR